ncbi:MAG TPA: 50S ribosomal protein L17 [Candidatus Paceibacterota bacterium]|nr:50S ribosomal protein L17 [Candidatus Paceibacterota bacterium]
MKHGKKRRTLNRTKRQRVALLRGLARSLVLHDGITTTAAKAKELRPFVEELVTASKANTVASRRLVTARLNDKDAVKKLHDEFAKRYVSRSGGYTRIVKLGRVGKRVAEMARIEFVA